MSTHSYIAAIPALLTLTGLAWGQDVPVRYEAWSGVVTANEVNVRSGPDANYYPTARLTSGARLQVIGEQFGWLKIAPAPGMFSLIERSYLDLTADGRGVVNADGVNVRAGTDLSDHAYARQLKLNRGDVVRILGQKQATLDGKTLTFHKIEPPAGAYFWISAQYVSRESREATPALDRPAMMPSMNIPREPASANADEADSVQLTDTVTEVSGPLPSPGPVPQPADTPETQALREQLSEIETDLEAEFDKPVVQRDVQPLIDQLKPLASQDQDMVVRQFAAIRIDQLEHQASIINTIKSLRDESRSLETARQTAMQARAEIRIDSISVPRSFDLTGELRESRVYNSPALPRRYRLVDPTHERPRTLAYIEVPRDSGADIEPLIGRYVGIIAASRSMHSGLVETVPIVVPAEIFLLPNPGENPPPEADEESVEAGQTEAQANE